MSIIFIFNKSIISYGSLYLHGHRINKIYNGSRPLLSSLLNIDFLNVIDIEMVQTLVHKKSLTCILYKLY